MSDKFNSRIQTACKSLYKGIGGPMGLWESGSELIGVIELRNGKRGQFQLTLTTDENDFLDEDGPTGCGDDLIINVSDFT